MCKCALMCVCVRVRACVCVCVCVIVGSTGVFRQIFCPKEKYHNVSVIVFDMKIKDNMK